MLGFKCVKMLLIWHPKREGKKKEASSAARKSVWKVYAESFLMEITKTQIWHCHQNGFIYF